MINILFNVIGTKTELLAILFFLACLPEGEYYCDGERYFDDN